LASGWSWLVPVWALVGVWLASLILVGFHWFHWFWLVSGCSWLVSGWPWLIFVGFWLVLGGFWLVLVGFWLVPGRS